jgi:hypothetical protein
MSDGRFVITTTLEGYINALKPSGKFNNCTIGFRIPEEQLPEFDAVYEQSLEWGKNKMAGKRFTSELPKWDESGLVKVSYGGDSNTPMFLSLSRPYRSGPIHHLQAPSVFRED